MQLTMDYQQKKAEEDMQKQQFEMEKKQYEMQMSMQKEMEKFRGQQVLIHGSVHLPKEDFSASFACNKRSQN